jgi:hypothetical protein
MTAIPKSHVLYLFVVATLIASSFLTQSTPVYAQGASSVSPDIDGDGLPNTVEQNGWYNASGGPFITSKLDTDSDDDGLTDGEEKLYDTNPLDDHSPGIYAEYKDDLHTQQYFPWLRRGSKYVALPYPYAPSYANEAIVVRRGTTFSVGGAAGAQLEIQKSIGSLTTLTAVHNPCSGRWDITVPSGGTVGIYTITVRDGGWSESLKLYVIFEIPTGLSNAFKDGFLYDDDPADERDTSSIGYVENDINGPHYEYTHADYSWIPSGEWIAHGYIWRFQTQHYDDFVFEDHVMPTINGKTNTWSAANALGHHVDDVTCFGFPRPLGNSWCVLHPSSCGPEYNNKNQCTNIANLLTAFNRAAGIPARPVFTDWIHDSFDHSTEVWTRPSGGSWGWYVMRGYDGSEGSCPDPHYTGGINELRSTRGWYTSGQGVYAAREDWSWNDFGGVNPYRDMFRMASWDFNESAMTGKIVKRDTFESRFRAYLGWPSEPQVTGTPPGDWPSPPSGGSSLGLFSSAEPPVIQFNQITADYGVDLDGDGRYDQLVFQIQVNALQAGDYWIRGVLDGNVTGPLGGDGLAEAIGHVYLSQGLHTIELPFDGMDIYMSKANGPYSLRTLSATDVPDPTKSDFAEHELAFSQPDYQTAAYSFNDFGIAGATLSGEYNSYTVDTDGNGQPDALVVETNLNIQQPDTYTVQGVLYGNQEQFLAEATWSGTGPQVTLQFDGLENTTGPYALQYLHVRNAAGQVTDGIAQPYPLGDLPELSAKPISLGVQAAVPSDIGPAFLITGGYADTRLDTDGDGKFDQLVISTAVQVEASEGGQAYRLEGWLVDQHNDLVAWAISDPQVLSEGVHSLSLAFDGRIINEHGVDGPFTLIALKALPGNTYNVLNQVDVAYTTPAYSHDEFEEPITSTVITPIFRDNMENGSGPWVSSSPWSVSNDTWSSYSHAWKASASGSQTGSLSLSLDMPDYTIWFLTFQTCYVMQSANDAGYFEASTDNVNWTRVATYTNSTAHWTTQFFALDNHDENPTLQLRFKAQSQNGLRWYIDDVSVSSQHIRYLYLPLILK